MFMGPLLLVGIIAAIVLAVQRGPRHDEARSLSAPATDVPPSQDAPLSDTLSRWVADGLLSSDQAQRILEHERAGAETPEAVRFVKAPAAQRRIPLFAEALGYLGGVLALSGLVLLIGSYWPDLSTAVRLILSLTTALALVGAGALVNEESDPALARLRWFLWTLASAAAALFTRVVTADGLDVGTTALIVAACAGAVALTSGALWWGHDRPMQELLFFTASIVGAATFVAGVTDAGIGGLTAWLLAAVVLAAGLRGATRQPIVPHVVGAIAIMVGAFVTVSTWIGAGALLVLATAGGLLVLAALPQLPMDVVKRVVLVVVAGIGALQGIPMTLGYFADEAGGATGVATCATGGALMAVGARRLLRAPVVAELIGGLGLIGGAALTATQWPSFAPLFGLGTAAVLLVIGMLPGRVLYSLFGSVGLLINVPWTINRFFPGEGRAPLLILVSGVLIVAVAVGLARQGNRLRAELSLHEPGPARSEAADNVTSLPDGTSTKRSESNPAA